MGHDGLREPLPVGSLDPPLPSFCHVQNAAGRHPGARRGWGAGKAGPRGWPLSFWSEHLPSMCPSPACLVRWRQQTWGPGGFRVGSRGIRPRLAFCPVPSWASTPALASSPRPRPPRLCGHCPQHASNASTGGCPLRPRRHRHPLSPRLTTSTMSTAVLAAAVATVTPAAVSPRPQLARRAETLDDKGPRAVRSWPSGSAPGTPAGWPSRGSCGPVTHWRSGPLCALPPGGL